MIGCLNLSGCGKSGHKFRDFPYLNVQDNISGQAQASGSNIDAPRRIALMHFAQGVNKRVLLIW